QVSVAVVAILVENDDYRSHIAVYLLEVPDIDPSLIPAPNGLPHVNTVQNGRGERFDTSALFRQNALALFLQEAPIVLDYHLLGPMQATALAVHLAGPFARGALFFPLLQTVGPELLLGIGQTAAQPDPAGIDPYLFAGDAHGGQIGLLALRGVAAGRLPNFPG